MGHHINADDEFQSDKYDWCPPGFFALKFTDPLARELIYKYADSTPDDELRRDLFHAIAKAEKDQEA